MIDIFKKEIASQIIIFCDNKARKYGIPVDVLSDTILGCSLKIIESIKDVAIHLVGVIDK